MKVVKVHGVLEEKLGQSSFEFDVNTPAEAIRALTANFSGLDKWLVDSEQDGIAYKVLIGKTIINEENFSDLGLPFSERETCLLYTSPSPRDRTRSRMPSSA